MPEIITCPSCQRKLQAPESTLGQDVQCPSCGATFIATFGAPPPRPAPVPRESSRPVSGGGRGRQADDYGRADDYGLDEERGGRAGWRALPPRADLPHGHVLPHRGAAVLTLGILALVGLVICVPSLILGPIAWVMGSNDLVLIRSGRMDRSGEGMTAGGQTCGIIATILGGIGLVLVCLGRMGNGPFGLGRRGW
jgi:hypothetical protein